jgi:hypothetical protein
MAVMSSDKVAEPFDEKSAPVWKSKFHGAFALNRRVALHAIDATPARWRGDASFLTARPSQDGRGREMT